MKLSRSKKGVGSVIGAVFVVLIILSGFTFYEIALLSMNNYTAAVSSINQADRNRSNENLSILSVQTTNDNDLNITAKNTGNIHSTIIWLGIFNQSVTPEDQGFFSVSQQISIGEIQSFLSPFKVTPDQKYAVQLITKEGNIFDYTLYPPDQATLALSLIAVPPTVYQSNNITLLLTVTNNNTDGIAVENITVSLLTIPFTLTTLLTSPSSLTTSSLAPGASNFFTWTYAATEVGTVLFEATYNRAPQGAFASATVTILEALATANQGQVTITGTNATVPYNPTLWNTMGGTSHVSGTIQSLSANDFNTVAFAPYYTGSISVTNQFVTSSMSDVDGSPNVGSIDNFVGMQSGPDGNYATLTEEQTSGTDGSFGNPSSSTIGYTNINSNRMYGGVFTSESTMAASVNSITFYGRASSGTRNAKAVICDSSGYILTNGISDPLVITTTAEWYTLTFPEPPIIYPDTEYWLMIVSSASSIRLYYTSFIDGNARLDISNIYASPNDPTDAIPATYQYCIYANTSSIGYRLDFEVQWTDVDIVAQTNDLAIYLAGQSRSEDIAVDVWVSGEWQNLFSGLSTGWNNISVTTYLTSSTFTIRFRDASPTDSVGDSWNIDVALLRQISQSDQYTAMVEFVGSSNNETWTSLIWNVASQFDSDNINITIQFYNFTLGAFESSGSAYASFMSIADASNLQSGSIASNSSNFKDSAGVWKLKITAVKDTSTPFNMYVDWIEITPTYISSGDTLPYGAIQNYIVTSTSANDGPTPYVYVSIYANGSSINLQDAITNQTIPNPAWVQLDSNGIYQFRLQSTSSSQESFVIFASVGTTVGRKSVLQEAQ